MVPRTGTPVLDRAQVLWNAPGGTPVQVLTFGILIEHDDGLVLVDTDLDLSHAQRAVPFMQPKQRPDQTVIEGLKLCGFSATDVTMVVNFHLHFDHVGGNRHFRHAEVVVHERELAQARCHESFERYACSDGSWDHADARLMPVAGDYEPVPGLRLYETPGHPRVTALSWWSQPWGTRRCCSGSMLCTCARRSRRQSSRRSTSIR